MKLRIAGAALRFSDSAGLGRGPGICMSDTFRAILTWLVWALPLGEPLL